MPEHPDPARLWRHRRRLVYASWVVLTGVIVAAVVVPERIQPAQELLQSALWVLGLHIVAYYGTAVAEAFAKMKQGPADRY